jgi:spore coat protein U-like protein
MTKSLKYFASAAALTCSLIAFAQSANAVALFFGTKRLDLTNSPNDCLTIAIGTLNSLAFGNLKRSDVDVFGTREGGVVSITCIPSPAAPVFVAVVMAASDNEQPARSLVDLVVSNL